MQQNFNQLTPAQVERLAILSEECGEVVQIIGKILRHGYESYSPYDEFKEANRSLLMKEIGNIDAAVQMLADAKEVDLSEIDRAAAEKFATIKRYTHHQ